MGDYYWFGIEVATDPRFAWDFSFYDLYGGQYWRLKDVGGYDMSVLAVRDGDVASVPEPSTLLLLSTGLVGLLGTRGRFKRKIPIVTGEAV